MIKFRQILGLNMFRILENSKKRAIFLSLVVGFLIMSIKFLAYYTTGSSAILTDASESIVNVIAAAFAFYSLYLAEQPKDENHPYGHGKIEFFSSGLEGVLIMMAGILTIVPAIWNLLISQKPIENILDGIYLIIVTILVNGLLGLYLIKTGKATSSIVLEADGKHLLVDSVSSFILLAGLFLVKFTGIYYLDSVVAIGLAIFIMVSGYKIARKSIGGLMDETDFDMLDKLIDILKINRKDRWIDIHNFRVKKYGADIHIDCHLTLPYYLNLEESHDEVSALENILKENLDAELEIFIHSDPCIPQCCHYCRISNCAVRKSEFDREVIWNKQTLITDQKHIEY